MGEGRKVTLSEAQYAIVYHTKDEGEDDYAITAFFKKDRFNTVLENAGKGFVNVSEGGEPSYDVKIKSFKIFEEMSEHYEVKTTGKNSDA